MRVAEISAGVAKGAWFGETSLPANLMAAADRELYRAKTHGRNVVWTSSETESLQLAG